MNIRECELPGIGQKFEIQTNGNEKIVVILHEDGQREIYQFDSMNAEESSGCVTLTDEESRQIAAILGGIIYKPKAIENLEHAFEELVFEWCKVDANASIINRTIGELKIRDHFGVTIIAIVRKNREKVLNPGANEILQHGDTVVLSGERANIQRILSKLFNH
ncbi:cation:proton antiporter regulatory subunit [Heyndrickxia vini]|uniref:Cation:proton antiporter regulatory subunit n=1 Tax=Heyndrickxia vini TaxID=1476025 RepID=A0ABX7E171_9BACI|nr:cation:proton antiporter regulatory subunit [Heyndrickxia vini]QQZ08939.1 cation:proton antiporter regulatory subunit [Heyndrickxia vini]